MTYLKRIKFIFKQVWRKMLQKYMLILSVNFENIIVGLHVIIIFFILAKFPEFQRSIAMSPNKC